MSKEKVAKTEVESGELFKVIVSGWLGTAMEFMDFQLYGLAAALVFNQIFFTNSDPAMGFIMAMGTFGAGYIARLVGAFFFGRMGDKIGRKSVMFFTIALMGAATTLIGFLPGYDTIGILAPILLVLLRIVQGFGAGAEIASAGVMVGEFAPKKTRGLMSSFVCLGTCSGTLAATGIWALLLGLLPSDALLSWGWRIPFWCSALIMIFAVWIRLNMKESPVMEEKKALREKQLAEKGIKKESLAVASSQKKGKAFFAALGLRFGQALNSGLMQTFLIGYIATNVFNGDVDKKSVGNNAILIASAIALVTIPLVGKLGDIFGRRKMYITLSILGIIFALPMMLMIESKNVVLITIALIIGINISVQGMFSLENITLTELFGAKNRLTQLALAKEIAGLLSTGFGPLIAATLVAVTNSWVPVIVMIALGGVVALISSSLMPETKERDLLDENDAI
jgi:MHS family metabolite:H+ symporter-like MFS transporter